MAADRLASEEPETEIETEEEALKVLRDLQADNRAAGQRMAERMAVMVKRKVLRATHTNDTGRQNTFFFFCNRTAIMGSGDGYPTTKRRQSIQIVRTYTSRLPCP